MVDNPRSAGDCEESGEPQSAVEIERPEGPDSGHDTRQPSPPRQGYIGFVASIGAARDGLLVGLGLLYIFGFLVVSVHAWRNNLGLLPVIEAQYFVAGIGPGLILLAALMYRAALILLLRKARPHFERKPILWRRCVSLGSYAVVATAVLFMLYLFWGTESSEPSTFVLVFSLLLVVLLALLAPLHYNQGRLLRKDPALTKQDGALVGAPIVVALWLYVLVIYPSVPQEFGGLMPRPAYLDIVLQDASTETLDAFTQVQPTDTTAQLPVPVLRNLFLGEPLRPKTIRTRRVEIIFSGNSFMLVRPADESEQETQEQQDGENEAASSTESASSEGPWIPRLYEIDQDVVKSIIWLDR